MRRWNQSIIRGFAGSWLPRLGRCMPIYEYQCQVCAHRFEKLKKISAEPLLDCPACAAPALQKLLSLPGFRLGGQGWYETDFKTGNKKNLASSDSASACAAGGCGAGACAAQD